MNEKEFDEAMRKLNNDYHESKNKLYKEYAFSNNPYRVGDIISDHKETIKIKKIKWGLKPFSIYSRCIYFGPILKKNLELRKDGKESNIFQDYIIRKQEN